MVDCGFKLYGFWYKYDLIIGFRTCGLWESALRSQFMSDVEFGLIWAPSYYLKSSFAGELKDEGSYILQQERFDLPGHDPDRLFPRTLTAAIRATPVTSVWAARCLFFMLLLFKLNLLLNHRNDLAIFSEWWSEHTTVSVIWKDFKSISFYFLSF